MIDEESMMNAYIIFLFIIFSGSYIYWALKGMVIFFKEKKKQKNRNFFIDDCR